MNDDTENFSRRLYVRDAGFDGRVNPSGESVAAKRAIPPLSQTGFTTLDIETTGLSPQFCGIVEIAAYKVLPDGRSETFQTLVDPQCAIPRAVIAIHGIGPEMVRGAPCAEEVVAGLVDFAAGTPLVLHNAPFDMGFLTPIVRRRGLRWRSHAVFDTLKLAKRAFPGLRSYSLENLSRFFDFDSGGHHRALADCRYTAQLFELIRRKMCAGCCGGSCAQCASSRRLLGED